MTPIIKYELSENELSFLKDSFYNISHNNHWNNIVKEYQNKSRHYHNLSHIYSMLQIIDNNNIDKTHDIILAIFYHDIVYDSTQKDNELQSALSFERDFADILTDQQIKYIKDLIISTQKHIPIVNNKENSLLLDIDLAILGTDKTTYNCYTEAIRKEYHWVPLELYVSGRKKVLEQFLLREKIYYTSYFHSLWEAKARENIENEINTLNNQILN